MKRRSLWLGMAAAGGLAAGGGAALWRDRATVDMPSAVAPPDVWALGFEAVLPGAPPVRLARGKPLLLNFWATWCAPCITEMPLLDRFAQEQSPSGWQVLALAVDRRDAVRKFLAERRLSLPVALAGADGIDLSRSLGNRHGALPYTVIFDGAGAIAGQRLGTVDERQLDAWSTINK